jgi:hypothetical protein
MGSVEITELIRRHLREEKASIAAAQLAGAARESAPAAIFSASAVSSPYGAPVTAQRRFWFNVNAELVIYGATDPGAAISVAGRSIKLRPDGTFSFRFALPDGRYELPVRAISPDQAESREASLHFSRSTDYTGQVEAHPQEPGLRKPSPHNLP